MFSETLDLEYWWSGWIIVGSKGGGLFGLGGLVGADGVGGCPRMI